MYHSFLIHSSADGHLGCFHGENQSTTCKRMKLEHFLTPYTKINSKWIKDLNIRSETIKLLEETIGKTLSDIHHSRILYDPPPRILEIKVKINKWDLITIKSFCITKKTLFSSPLLILLIQAQSIVRLVLSHDLYL